MSGEEVGVLRLSARKQAIQRTADLCAAGRDAWVARNLFFYESDIRYMKFLVPPGLRILDLGCGTGTLLKELQPAFGVGVDISPAMVAAASAKYPELNFVVGDVEDAEVLKRLPGPFDVIIMSDTIGSLEDCQQTISNLHALCTPETRVVVSYYSKLWEPILSLAERIGIKMRQPEQNWLRTDDIENLLFLSKFESVKREWRQLIPRRLLGLGILVNRFIAALPIIRRACLRNYIVARPAPRPEPQSKQPSATVVVPCRNERGNIESAIRRIPRFCDDLEILFVEGHSKDGTAEEIERVRRAFPEAQIRQLTQTGVGKADAVRFGFANATGDVLMILDADLTTPPESLPKFYELLVSGRAEFAYGSRLVYPIEKNAMRFLNFLANHIFSLLFTWLLNQRFTDTLCGTKALMRKNYEKIAANRTYFGDFDPFGDFDLIFGAAKANLRMAEIPIAYASRQYGETQISRFRHGFLLLKMAAFAFKKFKAI